LNTREEYWNCVFISNQLSVLIPEINELTSLSQGLTQSQALTNTKGFVPDYCPACRKQGEDQGVCTNKMQINECFIFPSSKERTNGCEKNKMQKDQVFCNIPPQHQSGLLAR